MQSADKSISDVPVIDQLIEAIGPNATLALVEAYPGTTQRLPAISNVSVHPFVAVIGETLLMGLVKSLGASRDIYIPRCQEGIRKKRDQEIVREYLAGVKVNDLALKYYLSDRHIWRILKETNMQDDRQAELF